MRYFRNLAILLWVLFLPLPACAQQPTAGQVLDYISKATDRNTGFSSDMTMEFMSFSTSFNISVAGEYTRIVNGDGAIYTDGNTAWLYSRKENTVTIAKDDHKDGKAQAGDMFRTISKGYDAKLSQTSDGWLIKLKKRKDNTDSDAVSSAEILADRTTFLPKRIKFKKGLLSMTFTYSNFKSGISPESIRYSNSLYPDAKMIDKRQK